VNFPSLLAVSIDVASPVTCIYAAWLVGLVFWAIAAIFTRRTVQQQSQSSQMGQGAIAGAGFVILLNNRIPLGPLDARFRPDLTVIAWAGFAITAVGIGVMAWSRIALGRNWSANVTIKQGHELVRSGPYAFVRHPLYSGVLLAMLGTAIAFGQLRGLVGFALTFAGWWLKSRTEEQFMLQQFGARYEQYRREVKALIPYVL
jgi:protein-S-isoprenylcysteine O-methyltransferase